MTSVRPFVKICGLTRPEDAKLAVSLGATHIGAVCSPDSPRAVDASTARRILDAADGRAQRVFVFRGVDVNDVIARAKVAAADIVQIYDGTEDDLARIESEGFRVLRVYRMREGDSALPVFAPVSSETRLSLLDVGGGGTGKRFDWSLLSPKAPERTFIAGGIRPDNVVELLNKNPYGIDLASGVESAPGVKDPHKLDALFERLGSSKR